MSRRTILAIDRQVRIGHHVYPDLPLDDLVDALIAGARPRKAGKDARQAAGGRLSGAG